MQWKINKQHSLTLTYRYNYLYDRGLSINDTTGDITLTNKYTTKHLILLAYKFGCGFVPARKPGKLPAVTIKKSYAKEYGVDTIELHSDAITEDDVVLIHDDLLATGGTMAACADLVKSMNPKKVYVNFAVELEFLEGRKNIPSDCEVTALMKF